MVFSRLDYSTLLYTSPLVDLFIHPWWTCLYTPGGPVYTPLVDLFIHPWWTCLYTPGGPVYSPLVDLFIHPWWTCLFTPGGPVYSPLVDLFIHPWWTCLFTPGGPVYSLAISRQFHRKVNIRERGLLGIRQALCFWLQQYASDCSAWRN